MASSKSTGKGERFKLVAGLSIAWVAIALVVTLFFSSNYTGIFRVLAEWQFAVWGKYYPIATVLFIITVLFLPIALFAFIVKRRKGRDDQVTDDQRDELAKQTNWQFQAFFLGLAAMSMVVLVTQLADFITQPGASETARAITVSELTSDFDYEGSATISGGTVRTDIVASLKDGIPLLSMRRRFAPVQLVENGQARPVTLFLQVVPGIGADDPMQAIKSGILERRAMPNEVINLYRQVDVPVADQAFVLHSNAWSMQARKLLIGGAALIFALFFAFVAHRTKKTSR